MGKGSRNEREAVSLLGEAGYATYRPATVRYGENDVWGLFDVLAIAPHLPLRGVQVKTNKARGVRKWARHTSLFRAHGFRTEMWVRHDREGWRVIACTDTGRETVYDGRERDGKIGEGVRSFLLSDGTAGD